MPFEKHSRSMRDHCANMSSHYVSRYFPHYNLTIWFIYRCAADRRRQSSGRPCYGEQRQRQGWTRQQGAMVRYRV